MKLVLASLAAGLAGFALGMLVTPSADAPSDATRRSEPSASDARTEPLSPIDRATEPRDEREPRAESATDAAQRVEEGLISAALRRYALEGIDAGWHEQRNDALPQTLLLQGFDEFEGVVRTTPRAIGRRLAGEATQRERLASDDPFAVLGALEAGGVGPQPDLVADRERFERFFACSGGPRVDGIEWMRRDADARSLAPGSTIDFPPGVYDVDRVAERLRSTVRCVTISGAGMDRTLLRVHSFLTTEPLDRLQLRDCTWFSQCEAIDLRAAGVWNADHVRFVGFDCGAGGCGLFDVGRGAILELEGCRIEGGFGRNPGDSCLFDLRSSRVLARISDCTLSSIALRSSDWGSRATVLFERCLLTDLLDREPPATSEDGAIVLRATTARLRDADAGRLEARKLSEINPAW